MKTKLICINVLSLLILFASCYRAYEQKNDNEISKQIDCLPISKETAILIAEGYLFRDYDLINLEVKIETQTADKKWKEIGEMWKITFKEKGGDRNTLNDDLVIWIYKKNGKVFTVKHQK